MSITQLNNSILNYVQEVEQFFKNDPNVYVIYYEKDHILSLYINNKEKASALSYLMPTSISINNTTLDINVTSTNGQIKDVSELNKFILFNDAFFGNPVYSFTKCFHDALPHDITYVVFKKEIAQFFTDDLNDLYGQKSMLYQDIAKDIFVFNDNHVYFCTEK